MTVNLKPTTLTGVWKADMIVLLAEVRNLLYSQRKTPQTSVTGKTFGFPMILDVGKPVTKIFFSRYNDNENVPVNTRVFAPHRHFKTLILINEGPADVIYQVNAEGDEDRLTSTLRFLEERIINSEVDGISSFFCQAVPGGGPEPATTGWGGLTLSQAYLRCETIT